MQPPPEQESEPNQLFATAACLMDGDTGRVLFGKRETDPMAMASTTKIMTCILALENGRRAGSCDSIRPGGSGTESPSRCVARASSFCLAIYLYSLMLESHNDAAVMIAETISGSIEGFACAYERKSRCNRLYGYTFCDPKRS